MAPPAYMYARVIKMDASAHDQGKVSKKYTHMFQLFIHAIYEQRNRVTAKIKNKRIKKEGLNRDII
jgi:hypothetical protein